MDLIIYGAQAIALGAYKAITYLYPEKKILCFAVTERGTNARQLVGLPVCELGEFVKGKTEEEKAQVEVVIATPENVMPEIECSLEKAGLRKFTRLTSLRWAELMRHYYKESKEFLSISVLPVGNQTANVQMYMAKHYKDKKLAEAYDIPNWIVPVQVGATLCKERIAEFLDCEGVHISEKNVNYCELTALYWMWKNKLACDVGVDKKNYFGLVHYRRILDLSEEDILRLVDNDVDVVLPYPMPYEPNIEEHHKRYIKEADWKALLQALEEVQPEYAKRLPEILSQQYLCNYNILLAKEQVLSDYCEWLFSILGRVEELSVPKGNERSDRYIGYMGETLLTLYFMVNKERLNVVYTGCRFLM